MRKHPILGEITEFVAIAITILAIELAEKLLRKPAEKPKRDENACFCGNPDCWYAR